MMRETGVMGVMAGVSFRSIWTWNIRFRFLTKYRVARLYGSGREMKFSRAHNGDDGDDSDATNEDFRLGLRSGPAGAGRSPGAAERSGGAIWRRAGGKLREGGSRRRPAAIELGAYLVRAGRQDVKRGVVMELLALVGFLFVLALASYFFWCGFPEVRSTKLVVIGRRQR